ncbi:type IV toxin-antitoxin system AbiEi family antitoxin domain-containing protein [Specibacter cremeus]|uniref:type IV toxin-antitoxin system AbiEi family antitoxin domain-containing protein n=1 Tax=Specibacter cremeus TaxID=1629051 RepID=UPI000F7BAAAA|nr:type IV toxin-antitoxin system AbiEi family antitoxin domain-containing protein [Specibacter cremeus]
MNTPRLIRPADLLRVGNDPRQLAKLSNNGALARVRRGVYVKAAEWQALAPRAQYGLRAAAFAQLAPARPVFCHASAALLWGLWVVGTPKNLHVITNVTTGGRSRNGVTRHIGSLTEGLVGCGPFLLTDKLTTTVQLINTLPFPYAVAICDSSLRNPKRTAGGNRFDAVGLEATPFEEPVWNNVSPQGPALTVGDLVAAAEALPTRAARARALTVINFSSPLSGSAGESLSRSQLHVLGFPAPQLQRPFVLRDGSFAFVDFYFREQKTVGEFDGRDKYLRADWAGGVDTQQRVLAEKDREDQIRAQGVGFVRWTWQEMMNRNRFEQLLRQAGLPQK